MPKLNDKSVEEMSLKEIIVKLSDWRKLLLSKWKIIFLAGVIGSVLGITYSLIKKPLYIAQLSFALEDDKTSGGGGLGGALGIASQFGLDLGSGGGGVFSGDNLLLLIKSRSMIESALLKPINISGKKQTLADIYISFNDLKKQWSNDYKLSTISFSAISDRSRFTLQQDSVLGIIYKSIVTNNLAVDKADKKLSIINVKIISENELFSKSFAELLVKTVSDFYIYTKTKRAIQNVRILQHQTDSVRAELNGAISGVASSTDFNPNPNPNRTVLRVPSQRRQVDVQANQTILTQLVANLELSKVSLRKETPLIQIIDKPILPLEKERVGRLKGMLIGGLLFAFITTIFYLIKNVVDDLLI